MVPSMVYSVRAGLRDCCHCAPFWAYALCNTREFWLPCDQTAGPKTTADHGFAYSRHHRRWLARIFSDAYFFTVYGHCARGFDSQANMIAFYTQNRDDNFITDHYRF